MRWETYVPPLEDGPPSPDGERFGASLAWGIFCACTLLQLAVILLNRSGEWFPALVVMDWAMIIFGPIMAFLVAPLLPADSLPSFARNAALASLLMLAVMVIVDAAALASFDLLVGFHPTPGR